MTARTDMLLGTHADQIKAALAVSERVLLGQWVSLPEMIVARDVIEARTNAPRLLALMNERIEQRREARRAAVDGAIFLMFAAIVFVVVLNLGGF